MPGTSSIRSVSQCTEKVAWAKRVSSDPILVPGRYLPRMMDRWSQTMARRRWVAGFAIGTHVMTTQYHPEMTHGFILGLVGHLAHTLPAPVIAKAMETLRSFADTDVTARQTFAFFECLAKAAHKSIAVS
jgi:hypothetical protein